jgi:hypothetical protein
VGNDQLLAILCLGPWIERTREAVQDPLLLAHDLFDHAALRMSIPRKDMASMRHALVTLFRLERPRRSRRFRLSDFLRRPATQQAIELLYIAALAGLEDPEQHARWAQRLAEQGPGTPHVPHAEDGDESQDEDGPRDSDPPERGERGEGGGRGRRRRRGGRGRRRGRDRQERPAEGRPFGPQPQGPAPEREADGPFEVAAAAPADGSGEAGGRDEAREPNGHGEREGGGSRKRRRRRGRRGGARHGGGQAPAAAPPGAEPVAAQAEARAEPRPAQGGGRDQGQKGGQPAEGGRRWRRRGRGGRREDRPAQQGGPPRERKASRDAPSPPATQQGPGARNPEDVEDFFDW